MGRIVRPCSAASATMASSLEKSSGASGAFCMERHDTPKRTVVAPTSAMEAHSASRKAASWRGRCAQTPYGLSERGLPARDDADRDGALSERAAAGKMPAPPEPAPPEPPQPQRRSAAARAAGAMARNTRDSGAATIFQTRSGRDISGSPSRRPGRCASRCRRCAALLRFRRRRCRRAPCRRKRRGCRRIPGAMWRCRSRR